jgi:hypothetical protein
MSVGIGIEPSVVTDVLISNTSSLHEMEPENVAVESRAP